jgi:hypothetical protein
MKNIIKKLLREGLNDIAGFTNITPEERQEIDRRFNDFMKEDKESMIEHEAKLKHLYQYMEKIKTDPELSKNEWGMKYLSDEIKVLETSINATKNRNKKAVYTEIARNYLSWKRYEDDRIKSRESRTFNNEDIINLFVDALEGGSNYWYLIKHLPKDVVYKINELGKSTSEVIGQHILKGGYIQFDDVEAGDDEEDDYQQQHSDKDLLGTVDMDSILEAITLVKRDYPEVWENILDEQYDANDADVFLQLCVMGEVVFG